MELTDIRLRSVFQFDPIQGTFEQTKTLKYFRRPEQSEYPLDLNRGYGTFVHRNGIYPRDFDMVQHYLLHVDQTEPVLLETDFILHRHTLLLFMNATQYGNEAFEAFRFKGCIYIKLVKVTEGESNIRTSYAFKARQYLMTECLGKAPDTDTPIDVRMQQYGMFSAKVGEFRLLYSGEITGLSNTEPIGDLTDPKELDKCRLTTIRVVKSHIFWRSTYQYASWVRQAYLSGANQIVVAGFDDNGQVVRPIEVESMENLQQQKRRVDIDGGVQRIHQFLDKISRKLQDLDNPAVSVKFQLIGKTLVFEEVFETKFIDYVNQLHISGAKP